MVPHIRQIHRLVVDEQVEHEARVSLDGAENGMGTVERLDDEDVGWEVRRVCEYRHTGQLQNCIRIMLHKDDAK